MVGMLKINQEVEDRPWLAWFDDKNGKGIRR